MWLCGFVIWFELMEGQKKGGGEEALIFHPNWHFTPSARRITFSSIILEGKESIVGITRLASRYAPRE